MHWKRQLRRELNNTGHSFAPLRRSLRAGEQAEQKLPLSQAPQQYKSICLKCLLQVQVHTEPGSEAQVLFKAPLWEFWAPLHYRQIPLCTPIAAAFKAAQPVATQRVFTFPPNSYTGVVKQKVTEIKIEEK